MNIDIMDYVNNAEIKDAILSGLKDYAASNAERVISNAGYHLATDIANEHLGDNAPKLIAEQCFKVIADLSPHTLFDSGGYGYPESDARKLLDQIVREQKPALEKAVLTAIHNLTKREIVDIVKSGKVKLVVE